MLPNKSPKKKYWKKTRKSAVSCWTVPINVDVLCTLPRQMPYVDNAVAQKSWATIQDRLGSVVASFMSEMRGHIVSGFGHQTLSASHAKVVIFDLQINTLAWTILETSIYGVRILLFFSYPGETITFPVKLVDTPTSGPLRAIRSPTWVPVRHQQYPRSSQQLTNSQWSSLFAMYELRRPLRMSVQLFRRRAQPSELVSGRRAETPMLGRTPLKWIISIN